MLKTSQQHGNADKTLPLKSKDIKVKFRHYNSREKGIKIFVDIVGVVIFIIFGIMIILSIIEGRYINIVVYVIFICLLIIPIELVEGKLKRNAQKRLIESLVIKKEQINSDRSVIRYPTQDETPLLTKEHDFLIFVSYATRDAEIFKVSDICEALTKREEISDVLYWQEDMKDNIIKYMNDNLGTCDAMLLFCSPNALTSKPVEKEWTAADIMGKPIIPIFHDPEHIPPLLKTRLGVKLDPFDFQKNTDEIYRIILKKLE